MIVKFTTFLLLLLGVEFIIPKLSKRKRFQRRDENVPNYLYDEYDDDFHAYIGEIDEYDDIEDKEEFDYDYGEEQELKKKGKKKKNFNKKKRVSKKTKFNRKKIQQKPRKSIHKDKKKSHEPEKSKKLYLNDFDERKKTIFRKMENYLVENPVLAYFIIVTAGIVAVFMIFSLMGTILSCFFLYIQRIQKKKYFFM